MPPRHVTWKEAAEEMINGGWGGTYNDANDWVKNSQNDLRIIALLRDIAESLRVLRCSNFQAIPRMLDKIRYNTRKPKKKIKLKKT